MLFAVTQGTRFGPLIGRLEVKFLVADFSVDLLNVHNPLNVGHRHRRDSNLKNLEWSRGLSLDWFKRTWFKKLR